MTSSGPTADLATNHPDYLKKVRDWDRHMQRQYSATRIEDPHFLAKVEEYAQRLRIQTPVAYVADKFPAIYGGTMPNAMAYALESTRLPSAMVFTKQSFLTHNYLPHTGAVPPNETLWVLGHEMGHLKQGGKYLKAVQTYPRLAGLGGAVIGLMLLNDAFARSRKHKKEDAVSDKTIQTHLGEVAEEERKKIKTMLNEAADSHELDGPLKAMAATLNPLLTAGEYMAAAAVGGVGGRFITRQYMLGAEFEADRIGAQLCGDPRAGIRYMKASDAYLKNMPKAEFKELASNITAQDIVHSYFEGAHPATEARISELESLARKMEKTAAKNAKTAMNACETAMGAFAKQSTSVMAQLEKAASHLHL